MNLGTLVDLARRLRPVIVRAAQSLTEEEAALSPQLYDEWQPGKTYEAGLRLRRAGRVCVVNDGQGHVSQSGWEPENAPALFRFIDETHAGTADDPIPYAGNMALEAGLYYAQDGATYLCTRDTGTAVYHALSELVGLYVEAA